MPFRLSLCAEGRSFRKHSAVEAAVHRDLVRARRWSPDLGESYSRLQLRRITGDYGGEVHVAHDDALDAIEAARRIVDEVRRAGSARKRNPGRGSFLARRPQPKAIKTASLLGKAA